MEIKRSVLRTLLLSAPLFLLFLLLPFTDVFAEPSSLCSKRFAESPSSFASSFQKSMNSNDPQIKRDVCGLEFIEDRSLLGAPSKANRDIIRSLSAKAAIQSSGNSPVILHSSPTSSRKIFLNFETTEISPSNWWFNYWNSITSMQGFSLDNDFENFTTAENAYITEVWRDVSEDFAGLDVDVTTENPGINGLTRSSNADTAYGMTAHISSDYTQVARCRCGGVAYMSLFNSIWESGVNLGAPVWNFASHSQGFTLTPEDTAFIVSHEVGHSVGLDHDGTTSVSYYPGHSNRLWAPIMGTSYGVSISQWSINEYANGRRTGSYQNSTSNDDFEAMALTGLPIRIDDFGSNINSAEEISSSSGTFQGVVGANSDSDFFKFTIVSNSDFTFNASNYLTLHPNLDIQLELYNQSGTLVSTVNPPVSRNSNGTAAGLNAQIETRLTSGIWYVKVSGTGALDPLSTGYSSYSSVGKYSIDYEVIATSVPKPVSLFSQSSNGSFSISFVQPLAASFPSISKYEYSLASSTDGSSYTYGPWVDSGISPSSRSFIVSNLDDGKTYKIKLRASEGASPGATSDALTVNMPPSAPQITTYTYLNGEATVNFSTSTFGETFLVNYQYAISADGGNSWGSWWDYQPNKQRIIRSPIYIWSGLQSGKVYNIKLRARNIIGFSLDSGTGTIDTRVIPRITSISPSEGLAGANVEISGSDFVDVTSVQFGSTSATYSVVSSNRIIAQVPSGFETANVRVSNPIGTSISSQIFTLRFPPTISGFSPDTAVPGTAVTILGANLGQTSKVELNNLELPIVSKSSTSLIVRVATGASTGKLIVTTPWGQVRTASDLNILPPPVLTSFTPNNGKPNDAIVLRGSNFVNVTSVTFAGIFATFTVDSSTQITTRVPFGYAQGRIRVITETGTAESLGDFVFRKSD